MNKDELKIHIEKRDDLKFLKHASNILAKINNWSNLNETQKEALPIIGEKYVCFLKENDNLSGFTKEIVKKRVDFLNNYYDFLNNHGYYNVFSSQGKFRSTILEEFMYLLLKDLIESIKNNMKTDARDKLQLGSSRAYTSLFFSGTNLIGFVESPQIGINQKDQDFAIYRPISLKIEGGEGSYTNLPIVSIENKTYIDKTMLEGSVATAEKIKFGNPYSLYYIVTENYDVDLKVDPIYSRIDQIYVLRKSKRKGVLKPIDASVVYSIVNDINEHLNRDWSNVEKKMKKTGKIL